MLQKNLFIQGSRMVIMAEKIIEDMFSRKIFIETEDIFFSTAELAGMMEKLGARRTENIYETDGPRKRTSVVYVLTNFVDGRSRARITFDIKADSMLNILTLTISAAFEVKTDPEAGFFTKTFFDFYVSGISPVLRKIAAEQIKDVWKQVEYQLRLRFKYSYA